VSAAKVVGVVAGGAMAAAAMTAAVVAAETTSAGTNSGATFMAEAPLPRAAMAVDDSARVVRIAVVPAGATLEGTSAAPPSTTDAPFDARVTTLAEAIAWGATHAAGATGIEITLAGAVHEVRDTVRIPADMPRCTIVGAEGARVVGGVLVDASQEPGSRAGGADADGASTGRAPGEPAATPWAQPDPSMLARVAEEARPHLRVWRLPEEVRASLAGPAHSGLQVDTPAVHSELFVGGRALTLARWPNTGYASIGSIVDAGSVPRNAMPDIPAAQRVFEPDRGGVFVPADRSHAARWSAEPGAWALGYWNWDWAHEQLPIASVDAGTGAVRLAQPHRYGLAARGRFVVLNAPGELDAVGEYWIDRAAGCVYAWLPPGGASGECVVSLAGGPLLALEGVTDFTVRGVSFECARGGAIDGRRCARVRIEGCAFRNIGARAVDLDGRENLVARCTFTDIGGEGVDLTGGDRRTLARGDNAVEDCTFLECGRLLRSYHPAVRIDGVGNRVSRCAFLRHPHIALMFQGNDHVIESSEFADIVYETGDAGAVYCGRDWTAQGTVIRGNIFRDIAGSDARFQNGVYLDDMASGIVVEHNLFVRCNWGALIGGGRDVTLRDNAFVSCGKAVSWDARGVGWMASHIADPATSTLHQRYRDMPVAAEPWATRYPHLGDYLTHRFGEPVRGVLSGSLLVATPIGRIDDRELVTESGTTSAGLGGAGARDADASASPDPAAIRSLLERARRGAVEIGRTRLGPVGPRPDQR